MKFEISHRMCFNSYSPFIYLICEQEHVLIYGHDHYLTSVNIVEYMIDYFHRDMETYSNIFSFISNSSSHGDLFFLMIWLLTKDEYSLC